MNRLFTVLGGAAAACAIAVPAAAGLAGNPSFGEGVQVRVPASATIVSFDDHGKVNEPDDEHGARHPEFGDDQDRHGSGATAVTTTAGAASTDGGADRGSRHREPGDDHRRHDAAAPTASATEPGDDNHRNRHGAAATSVAAPTAGSTETGDDHGDDHGADSATTTTGPGHDDGSHTGHGGHGDDD